MPNPALTGLVGQHHERKKNERRRLCTLSEKIVVFDIDDPNDCDVCCNCHLSLANQYCSIFYLCFIIRVCSILYELYLCILGVSVCWKICAMRGRFLSSVQSNSEAVQECQKIGNSIQHFPKPCLCEFLRDHTITNIFSVCAKRYLFTGVCWDHSCLLGNVYVVHLSSVWHKTYLSRRTDSSQNKRETKIVMEMK